MNSKMILSLAAIAAVIFDESYCSSNADQNGSLSITISFESEIKCTTHFFGNQLTQAILKKFKDCKNIHWTFEPCENSHIEPNSDKLTCQKGEVQCALARMQSCAGKLNENNQFHFGIFVACTLNSRDPMNCGRSCATEAGLCWDKIDQCVKSGEGDKYCNAYNKVIEARRPPYIPSIMFDGTYVDGDDTMAKEAFTKTVCQKLKAKNLTCAACGSAIGDD